MLIIAGVPLTFSIAAGIGLGVVVMAATGARVPPAVVGDRAVLAADCLEANGF